MRIVDIRETVVPIKSEIRNAYIDFSQMTVSVLALVTDVIREGKPVVGFGFNSNGRYAPSGLLRDRFIPRLKAADPTTLVDESRENLDQLDRELVRLAWEHSANESLAIMVRSIHTIKGTSGFLGFPHIERVAHAGECLRARLRDGQFSLTGDIRRRVAAMAAAVRPMLGEIESTGHDGENDYPDLLAELNRLANAASAGS